MSSTWKSHLKKTLAKVSGDEEANVNIMLIIEEADIQSNKLQTDRREEGTSGES